MAQVLYPSANLKPICGGKSGGRQSSDGPAVEVFSLRENFSLCPRSLARKIPLLLGGCVW